MNDLDIKPWMVAVVAIIIGVFVGGWLNIIGVM